MSTLEFVAWLLTGLVVTVGFVLVGTAVIRILDMCDKCRMRTSNRLSPSSVRSRPPCGEH